MNIGSIVAISVGVIVALSFAIYLVTKRKK